MSTAIRQILNVKRIHLQETENIEKSFDIHFWRVLAIWDLSIGD